MKKWEKDLDWRDLGFSQWCDADSSFQGYDVMLMYWRSLLTSFSVEVHNLPKI